MVSCMKGEKMFCCVVMHHFNKFILKYKHLFIIALGTADVKMVCEILAEEEKEEASLKKQLEKKLVDNKVFSSCGAVLQTFAFLNGINIYL